MKEEADVKGRDQTHQEVATVEGKSERQKSVRILVEAIIEKIRVARITKAVITDATLTAKVGDVMTTTTRAAELLKGYLLPLTLLQFYSLKVQVRSNPMFLKLLLLRKT